MIKIKMNFLQGIATLLAGGIGRLGKGIVGIGVYIFTSKALTFGFISLIFLSIITIDAITQSVQEKTPQPFFKTISGTLFAVDRNVDRKVEEIKIIPTPTKKELLWSGLNIVSNLWWIIIWWLLVWKLIMWVLNQSEPRFIHFFWVLVVFTFLHITYQLVMVNVNQQPFKPDEWESWRKLIPFTGVVNFIKNVDIWINPLADIVRPHVRPSLFLQENNTLLNMSLNIT